ncbi:Crp/Fnr family transcriptional regulator [Actinoplanes sp. KI2]|uniref:Crp/Fnr family transcriptional regulator n=1 Tax=Actinoplanes sp. KI2 TaxID=2983315 RepID=UPI0021D579B1|nr:Crp/Fnr family transcriptional regulator [Actinoplanes sp. KI2]MCU7722670.1 Crp/Fnr family transcriptional regulator [Actinoplanes sp. KI2]
MTSRWVPGSLLGGLTETTVQDLLKVARRHSAKSGEKVLSEGEPGGHVEIILRGFCKVSVTTPGGYQALLAIRGPGDLVGELAEFSGQARSATVTASGPVELAAVPHAPFQHFLRTHADVAEQVTRMVGDRLAWANRRRTDNGAYPAEARLARLLAELAGVCGVPEADGVRLVVPLSQGELAGLIGAQAPTVQKGLQELRRQGIVTTGYRRIVINDVAALTRWEA